MLRLVIILFLGIVFLSSANGQNKIEKLIPKEPIGWVSDFENVFTPSQIQILDSIILDHSLEKGNQVAIVTLSLDSVSINSLEEFEKLSLSLFNQWGIGQKGLNNGVAIIFCRNLRMIRIEVGRGLEIKLTNNDAKLIIDNIIIPEFRRANYYEGVLQGLQQIIKEIQ